MSNPEHLEQLLKVAEARHRHGSTGDIPGWNRWRKRHASLKPDLSGADLQHLCLDNADFSHANLRGTKLRGVHAHGANFSHADLSSSLLGNAKEDRSWWSTAGTDLSAANLGHANLAEADLRGVFLTGSDLTSADLREADLTSANLHRAKLHGSSLRHAKLTGSILTQADLRQADLRWAEIKDASLSKATIGSALFGRTLLSGLDLSDVEGLDRVQHQGPSSIDIDSIVLSQGRIPSSILLACGLPDTWIRAIHQTPRAGYYSCFISHSHHDEAFCRKLYEHLRAAGLRVWFSPEEMQGGKKLHEQIYDAIDRHDRLLLVLSEHSMASDWVKSEVRRAREREAKEGRQILFPIGLVPFDQLRRWKAFDADAGKDIAVEIREYFIPDFSAFNDDRVFELEVGKLVAALKA